MTELNEFLAKRKIEAYRDCEIKPYLTLRIGGRVRLLLLIRNKPQLIEILLYLQRNRRRFILLGGGSNVVFPDGHLDLIVIINKSGQIYKPDDGILRVNSGVGNADLLNWNIDHEIGGMEFLAGIPGTIGGAAAVNAGAFGKTTADILEKAEIFTKDGEIKTVSRDYFQYKYRDSVFKYSPEVILDVYLRFDRADSAGIREKIKANLKYRKDNHPSYKEHTAGCFFKNPLENNRKIPAGRLIEKAGLKGAAFKDLFLAPEHANFLVNRGAASFPDVDEFAQQVCRSVLKESGILLEREVIYISPAGEKY